MVIDEDLNVERVAYRLRKWVGVEVVPPTFGGGSKLLPHDSEHCERCRLGHYEWADGMKVLGFE